MEQIIETLQNFSGIINIAIVLSLFGIAYKIFESTISKKDAQVDLLIQQLNLERTQTIENMNKNFQSLKEYYEKHIDDVYEARFLQVKEASEKEIANKEKEFNERIEIEVHKRDEVIKRLTAKSDSARLQIYTLEDICGRYEVSGKNRISDEGFYKGHLTITNINDVVIGEWELDNQGKKYSGIGTLVSNYLALAFEYDYGEGASGVILYQIETPDTMHGYWAIFGKDSLGVEELVKQD